MARIRTIKPEFFQSEDVSELPMRARLTWLGLWTQCDDHGRFKDNVKIIKANVWSLDEVSLRDVESDLNTLADRRRIVRYQVDGVRYLAVVNWHHHQVVNRAGGPKYPAPPYRVGVPAPGEPGHCDQCWRDEETNPPVPLTSDSLRTHGTLTEGSPQEGIKDQGRDQGSGIRAAYAHTRDAGTQQGSWNREPQCACGSQLPARQQAATAHSPHAHWLVETYAATCNQRPPASVRAKLARHVQELVDENWPDRLVQESLTSWGAKGLDPAALPSVANEVANQALGRNGTNGKPTKDDKLRALQSLKSQPVHAIEGGSP